MKYDNINSNCEDCTISFDIGSTDKISVTPSILREICNCSSNNEYDYNTNNEFFFHVDNYENYSYNSKVKISEIKIYYDNIGLPYNIENSSKVYINGNMFYFTPFNLIPINFSRQTIYLYDEMKNTINIKNNSYYCNPCSNETLLKIYTKNQFFYINNLRIYAYGYIGNKPFEAISSFDTLTTTEALGFDLFSFTSNLCYSKNYKDVTIILKFNPCLILSSICPTTDFVPLNNNDKDSGFYASVNFEFNTNYEVLILKTNPLIVFAQPLK